MNNGAVAFYQPDSEPPAVPDLSTHDAYFWRRHSDLPYLRRATWPINSREMRTGVEGDGLCPKPR